MNPRYGKILFSLAIMALMSLYLTACFGQTETLSSPTDTPLPPSAPTDTQPPAITQPPPQEPQRFEFQAADGTLLVGEYFPSAIAPAPAVILMHQMGSNRQVWSDLGLTAWLTQGNGAPGGTISWPDMPPGDSIAVFAFDFRGHGESDGSAGERSDFLMDSKAALELVQGLPGIDPGRIAMIGASIGADAGWIPA